MTNTLVVGKEISAEEATVNSERRRWANTAIPGRRLRQDHRGGGQRLDDRLRGERRALHDAERVASGTYIQASFPCRKARNMSQVGRSRLFPSTSMAHRKERIQIKQHLAFSDSHTAGAAEGALRCAVLCWR